ncbi:MAG: phage terminase large subunit family protein [Paracoccaceae bacterium]|nr:phage terminase large subunit family protein [Paracoccaceae bacterium]
MEKHCLGKEQSKTASYLCPSCNAGILEMHKAEMVSRGVWRPANPRAKNHAGFHLNALASPLYNARWEIPFLIEVSRNLMSSHLKVQGTPCLGHP